MNEKRSDELTQEERRAFSSLPGAGSVHPELEDRIVASLKDQNLIRSEPWFVRAYHFVPPVPRLAMGFAALLIAFTLGMEYGKRAADGDSSRELLETEADPPFEPTEDVSGEMMALLDSTREETFLSGGKPTQLILAEDERAEFPPYPLDGTDRSFSPKYR